MNIVINKKLILMVGDSTREFDDLDMRKLQTRLLNGTLSDSDRKVIDAILSSLALQLS